jgi:beta-apo-4'-carotenal oxygenase
MESLLTIRYPPYNGKREQFDRMSVKTPNFDHEGNVKTSLLWWVFALGAGSKSGAVTRYVLVALCEYIPFEVT